MFPITPLELRKSGKDRSATTRMAIESQHINTVNSFYCGHCGDLESVSSLARVRNIGSLFQSNIIFAGIWPLPVLSGCPL